MTLTYDEEMGNKRAAWSAVFCMTLCAFVLIASEFMPVSLLTPIAADLGVSEGNTGQAISVSGVFAVITSLFIAGLSRRLDRRVVVLGLTALLMVSGIVVTLAPSYPVLMFGRALLGISIGGFWSMSTAIVMRLVSHDQVPKALALLNAGNAVAATVSAPLGSLLGAYIGWRGAFFLVVPIGLLALLWQWTVLPELPPRRERASANVFRLLGRSAVAAGMAAILLLFMGQFALFTYLRPFLEQVTRVEITMLSLLLLIMGLAGAVGTWVIGRLLQRRLFSILVIIPLLMAGIALFMVVFGDAKLPVAAALIGWGLLGTAAPVGWGTWLSRILPDDAEAGGGLQVAVIQLAITAGASVGGILFDSFGWWSAFTLSGLLLCCSSLAALAAWRLARRPS
ncbi:MULTISPECIES: MFS transporter [unclassified Agrobacterium]|uniref:MFS transporter n=1 Tax=unclassified Agrobacterium TaxID=2632611 RepID=UPI00244CE3AD|nr:MULTISPECIES: MFS transporter [unclassified Agrobacterium]MDH0614887.1 MFS transporter [Agrobacterium sp. GD03872]MDH0699569.1 MFS transporter [Agrobacterium sp. GD03871]MDH1061949.1 MFS transporter [Agrobacterium sp. GD03992]MDH2211657.1 MFS transporter [Agrobacterium sp. GD03643]MDH2220349.1 MFS transporter [Agrobacterium sp. GD03638]